MRELLDALPKEAVVFEQEYDPNEYNPNDNLPYTVEKSEEEENTYVVEGPKIERMLGYTNLDSEKGFQFFQNFLKDNRHSRRTGSCRNSGGRYRPYVRPEI